MSPLWLSIQSFVEQDILPYAQSIVRMTGENIHIELVPEAAEAAITRKSLPETGYIRVSKAWLYRLCYIFALFRSLWTAPEERSRIYALEAQNAVDYLMFSGTADLEVTFLTCPFLAALFPPPGHEASSDYLESFPQIFSDARNAEGAILDFDLEEELSDVVRLQVKLCVEFTVLHEIAHLVRGHKPFLLWWQYLHIPALIAKRGLIESYKRKAVEVDADSVALVQLMLIHEDLSFQLIYETIAMLFATFDPCRKGLRDYQGDDVSHPMPEIRFHLMSTTARELLEAFEATSAKRFSTYGERQLHKSAVTYVVESFRRLGVIGPFFFTNSHILSTNPMYGISEMALDAAICAEIKKIEMQYNSFLHLRHASYRRPLPWFYRLRGLPVRKADPLRKKMTLEMLLQANGRAEEEKEPGSGHFAEKLDALDVRKGDRVVFWYFNWDYGPEFDPAMNEALKKSASESGWKARHTAQLLAPREDRVRTPSEWRPCAIEDLYETDDTREELEKEKADLDRASENARNANEDDIGEIRELP